MTGMKSDFAETDRAGDLEIQKPEDAFLSMLQAEESADGDVDPKKPVATPPNSDDPEDSDDEQVEPEVPAEEESDDPDAEESDDLPETDDEDEDEGEEEVEETEDDLYEVTSNGVTERVTYDELIGGYSRTADYTRQTQEVGQERLTLATDREAVQAERAKYDGMLGQLEEIIEQATPKEPDWAKVRAETPDDYPALYADWTQRQEQLGRVKAERTRLQEQAQTDFTKARDEFIEQESTKLRTALPQLFDTETGPDLNKDMLQTALDMGYTQEQVATTLDSRALRLLHDATQYRLLRAKGKKVKAKAKRMRTVSPKKSAARRRTGTRSRQRAAEKRLRETGSVESAASVFLQDMTK